METLLSEEKREIVERRLELRSLLTLYSDYYRFHAEQRMKILSLFVSIEPALIGAYIGAYKLFNGASSAIFPLCALSLAMSLVAFIVWCMDVRTTELLHQVRIALRTFEATFAYSLPVELRLFTSVKRNERGLSFSFLVRLCYVLLIFVGFAFFLLSFFLCRG